MYISQQYSIHTHVHMSGLCTCTKTLSYTELGMSQHEILWIGEKSYSVHNIYWILVHMYKCIYGTAQLQGKTCMQYTWKDSLQKVYNCWSERWVELSTQKNLVVLITLSHHSGHLSYVPWSWAVLYMCVHTYAYIHIQYTLYIYSSYILYILGKV